MMKSVYISSIGTFLPNSPVANDQLDHYMGTVSDRDLKVRNIILRRNGIKKRHYAIDPESKKITHTNVQLAAEAGKQALTRAHLQLEDIDLLCSASSCPDQLIPNQAAMVQAEMNLGDLETFAPQGVCCASVTALKYAYLAVQSGQAKKALVTTSENSSAVLHRESFLPHCDHSEEDVQKNPMLNFDSLFLRWMLSDGAGAFVLSDEPNPKAMSFKIDFIRLWSYASKFSPCMTYGGKTTGDNTFVGFKGSTLDKTPGEFADKFVLRQNTQTLDQGLIRAGESAFLSAQNEHGLNLNGVKWFAPHISSFHFKPILMEGLARINVPIREDQVFTNLETKGNTGSAAISIILDELLNSNRVNSGDRVLCMVPESARFSIGLFSLTAVAP